MRSTHLQRKHMIQHSIFLSWALLARTNSYIERVPFPLPFRCQFGDRGCAPQSVQYSLSTLSDMLAQHYSTPYALAATLLACPVRNRVTTAWA